MEGLIAIIILIAIVGALDLLAYRFGADSRDVIIEAGRPARPVGLTLR